MGTLTDYIVLALAAWRLTSLLASEEGPWSVFDRLRARLGVTYDDYGHPQGTTELSRGIICTYCLSIWVAAALTALLWLFGRTLLWLLLPLAVSAAAVLMDSLLNRLEGRP